MCAEEVGAASQESWVGALIEILCDHLKRAELFGGEGQLKSFGDVAGLQAVVE